MADIELWQRAAVALDEYACNGDKGRDKRDPVYLEVVEKRDGILVPYEKYSSCGDRAHWKLWRLGVRAKFVNREERSPLPNDWHVGANISELHNLAHGSPCLWAMHKAGFKIAVRPDAAWLPSPGDELLLWNDEVTTRDAHSCSIISWDGSHARTANYGSQGMSKATNQGCKCVSVPLLYTADKGWICGTRKIQRVLPLTEIVKIASAPPNFKDLAEEYVFGDGGTLDALEGIVT